MAKRPINPPLNRADLTNWLINSPENKLENGVKPLLMGILNVTPDSFSDGGKYSDPQKACRRALQMRSEGADLIDIGGESTRPGAKPISLQEELDRVIPVIERIRERSEVCISIDTTKAQVMRVAVEAGADMINDINALRGEGALMTAASLNVPVVLMHMQGRPQSMQTNPQYKQGIVQELMQFFTQQIEQCIQAGIAKQQLILDIGFGFGKTVFHNLELMKRLNDFNSFKLPILIGVSRKSTLGAVLNEPVDNRLFGGIGLAVYAGLQGVSMIRTHDVAQTNQALSMVQAIYDPH